ncbi:hypothetical protein RRG08_059295 [Elysia crispata]|uniref:Uncharacterized protein n=1 Tax=Elysia crispata TaxID=231223 RepID=A0AAE0ZBS4_9GAST|nr:hypothetical protein RRG08_059295 [Elysia crispata]
MNSGIYLDFTCQIGVAQNSHRLRSKTSRFRERLRPIPQLPPTLFVSPGNTRRRQFRRTDHQPRQVFCSTGRLQGLSWETGSSAWIRGSNPSC